MKEGRGEITVNMEIPGMNMPMIPSQTYTHCITKKIWSPRGKNPGNQSVIPLKLRLTEIRFLG